MKAAFWLPLLLLGCSQKEGSPSEVGDVGASDGLDRATPEGLETPFDASPGDSEMDANTGSLSWTNLSAGSLPNSICGLSSGRLECITSQGLRVQGGDSHEVGGEIVTLPEGNDFIRVSGQADRGCVLDENWQVECWGSLQMPPADVLLDEPLFVDVAAGEDFVCALTDIGYLRCWGSTALHDHDLGLQSTFSNIVAEDWLVCAYTQYSGVCLFNAVGRRFLRDELGGPYRYVDLHRGEVWVIGGAGFPVFGMVNGIVLDPTFGNEPLREVAAGDMAVCALGEDETVRCEQRVEGDYRSPPEGIRFTALVAAGPSHCALDVAGHVWCWGRFPPNHFTGGGGFP